MAGLLYAALTVFILCGVLDLLYRHLKMLSCIFYRSYWIPGSSAPTLSEKCTALLRPLKYEGFKEERVALHQKSLLYRIFRYKNRSLWSRKSLQNEAKKVLLTDGSAC